MKLKLKLTALLLALLLLFAAGCTEKQDPKETTPPESERIETADPAEAEKNKRIASLLKIMNDDGEGPEKVFALLNGDYSLDRLYFGGMEEELRPTVKPTVNAYKDGCFYSEFASGEKRLSLMVDGYLFVVDCTGDEPQILDWQTEAEAGDSLKLIGSAGFTLASFFDSDNDTSSPVLTEEQILLDGDQATFAKEYLDAFAKALETENVEIGYDFSTSTLTMKATHTEFGLGEIPITMTTKYDADGRTVSLTGLFTAETDVDGQKVSTTLDLAITDTEYDGKGQLVGFRVSASSYVRSAVAVDGVNYVTIAKQEEKGTFTIRDGRPDVALSMDVTQTVSAAGQEQKSSYTVNEQIKPGRGDKYLVRIETYVGDVLLTLVTADCVFDGHLFPDPIPENVLTLCRQAAQELSAGETV